MARSKPLTELGIRNARIEPGSKMRKLSDGRGLQLWLVPSGSRLWKLQYYFESKQRTISLGDYPTITLGEARERREAARKLLSQGVDPSSDRKKQKLAVVQESANLFANFSTDWLDRIAMEGIGQNRGRTRSKATMKKARYLIDQAGAVLGKMSMTRIEPADILPILRRYEAQEKYETALRMRSTLDRLFRYAVATGTIPRNPAADLVGAITAPPATPRAAITEPEKVGELLRAISGYAQVSVRINLQLLAYLFPRPGELRLARWPEVDIEQAVWNIPAERTKLRRQHSVPLPNQAIVLLQELYQISGEGSFLFPSANQHPAVATRPISDATIGAALRRMGFDTATEHTPHGFRSTASSLLNMSGKFRPDVIEKALAHVDRSGVRAIYNRADYWPERVEMAQWYADYLDQLQSSVNGDVSVPRLGKAL